MTSAPVAMTSEAVTTFMNCSMSADGMVVTCNGTEYTGPVQTQNISLGSTWFWIYLGIYVVLVLFAGMMSGLTLGLLTLDTLSLRVLCEAGSASQRRHARRILPLVKRHHLLLVTLLLANAAAVESMPLFLDRISDPVIAIAVSVTAVLLFGEVFPQALCSRYGLAIGAALAPVVYVLMVLLLVVAWPLSKLLDCLLGHHQGAYYRRAELKALVGLHGPDGLLPGSDSTPPLSYDEVLIIKGALELRDKVVADAMVPLESVFMLEVDAVMDQRTVAKVLKASHSRVPIYDGERSIILGVLLIKRLIAIDFDDAVPVRRLIQNRQFFYRVTYTWDSTPLYDLLNEFQKGRSHLSVVRRTPYTPTAVRTSTGKKLLNVPSIDEPDGEVLGIITLEDVLEELLLEEIVDETDVYVDVHKRIRVARARANAMRLTSRENSTAISDTDRGNTTASSTRTSPDLNAKRHLRRSRSCGDHSDQSHVTTEADLLAQPHHYQDQNYQVGHHPDQDCLSTHYQDCDPKAPLLNHRS